MALVCVACIAGPQPEPPDTPRDAGVFGPPGMSAQDASRSSDAASPLPPAEDAAPHADAGPAGGWSGEAPPWADPDDGVNSRDDIAPFPFEPCCGWFALPDPDDAGTDEDAGTDAGTDAD